MTITARISTVLVTLVAAAGLGAATLTATAEAAPKAPNPTQLSASACETLKLLSNDMSKAAEEAYADGDEEAGDRFSKYADDYWAEAARGGCRWATWRNQPSQDISIIRADLAS